MQKKKGFSLIEILVSLAVSLVLLTGIAELLVLSLKVKMRAEEHIKIADLAAAKLEELKTYGFESGELTAGTSLDKTKDKQSQEYYCRETEIADVGTDFKKIEVLIYPETKPQRKTRVVLFVSRDLGF